MRPDDVRTREDLARGLSEIRENAGLSIRETAARADGIAGTVSGWFTGKHAPTAANEVVFRKVLRVCGIDDTDEQNAWVAAATRARRPGARKPATTPVPYRGFEAFQVADAESFFGRADVTERLVSTVLAQADNPTATVAGHPHTPVITLVGPSGAGKSSVLRAGLLSRFGHEGPFARWRYALLTPGADPHKSVDDAIAGLPDGDGPVLVAVDQLEELWTQVDTSAERMAFADHLLEFGRGIETLVIVLTIRADFYGSLAASPRLAQALQNAHILVSALDDTQSRAVITGPAAVAGVEVADELVDLLLADLHPAGSSVGFAGSLPLLSHALLSTWSVSDGRRLTVRDYLATGRIRGAVEQTAEKVYSDLDYAEKLVARRLLLAMTHVDEEMASRRRAPLAELGVVASDPRGNRDVRQRRVLEVLERFAGARMVTVSDTYAEVTHEALFSAWPRLAAWIDDDRANLTVHRRLRAAMDLWEESDRSPDLLIRGHRLGVFTDFAEAPQNASAMAPSELHFLAASNEREADARSAERRHLTQLRRAALAATAFAVVALVAAVIAIVVRSDAVSQQRAADQLRRDVLSAQLAVQADQLRVTDPSLSVQLAMSAYRMSSTIEARSSLLDASAAPMPVRTFTVAGPGRVVRSPDGSMVALVNTDNRVRLFATNAAGLGPELAEFGGSNRDLPLYAAAFSPDSRRLYVAGAAPMSIWDLSERTRPRALPGGPAITETVRDIAVDASGDLLVAAVDGGGTRAFRSSMAGRSGSGRSGVVAPTTWAPVELPADIAGKGTAVAFSADGRLLATARGGTKRVDLFRSVDGRLEPVSSIPLPGADNAGALGLAFSPTGDLAMALNTRDIKLYSLADPAAPVLIRDLTAFGSYVNTVGFSPDGRYLLGASSDNTTRVTDLTGVEQDRVLKSGAVVDSAAFVGDHVVSFSEDGYLKVWAPVRPSVQAGVAATFQFAFDSRGTDFLSYNAAPDGSVSQWVTGPGPTIARRGPLLAAPPNEKFSALSYGASGRLAVMGSAGGQLSVADFSNRQRPVLTGAPITVLPGLVETVDISERSKLVVAGSLSSNAVVVVDIADPARPRTVSTIDIGDGAAWAYFDEAGDRAVVTTPQGYVVLLDLSKPDVPRMLFRQKFFETSALAARFSPDQKSVVVTSGTKQVKVLDISEPTRPVVVDEMAGPSGTIYGGAFSRDGRMVAAGGDDGELWLWDVARRGHPVAVARLRSYPGRIYDVQFGPQDGTVLATGAPGVIQSWTVDPDRVVSSVCSSGTAPLTRAEWDRYLPTAPYVAPCG